MSDDFTHRKCLKIKRSSIICNEEEHLKLRMMIGVNSVGPGGLISNVAPFLLSCNCLMTANLVLIASNEQ